MRTAGVVGLGLMGGSMARDLAALGWRVLGDDPDPAAVAAARAEGVIRGPVRPDELDLLVLAAPVPALPDLVRRFGPDLPAGALATDMGSTKRGVAAAARAAGLGDRFVPAHPMAGDHRRGWAASRAGLFRDATVWICPDDVTLESAVERVEEIWRSLGARTRRIGAAEHDERVARASHLPQLAAAALAATLADAGIGPADLGPGGRDATRLAASDPALWSGILRDNADRVVPAVTALVERLDRFGCALSDDDAPALEALLREARSWAATATDA